MGTAFASITIFTTAVGGLKTSSALAAGTLTAFIRTKALSTGRDELSYFIDKISSHITNMPAQSRLSLEIYGADKENGPFELLDTIDVSLEDPGYTDPPGRRYYQFVFTDSAVRERWQLHGFDVYGEPGGDEF